MKKILICNISFCFVLFALFGCNQKTPSPDGSVEELKLAGGDYGLPSPFTFYPRGPGYLQISYIYDTLVWKDEKGIIPWLAERWEIEETSKKWIFHLRKGVKWHDGQFLTARDVAFTFDYLRKNPVEWFNIAVVDNVEVKDDYTIAFELKYPFAPFLNYIAGNIPIIPEHIWKNIADPRREARLELLVGTGPYKLVSYVKEQGGYEYLYNQAYFLGIPKVKRLLLVPVSNAVAALERHDIDANTIPFEVIERFKQNPEFKVINGPSFWVLKLQFNDKVPPFDRQELRQAFAYAIDREDLVKRATHGAAIPGNPGFLPPESEWYNPDVPQYAHNIEKAKELLDQVNIGEGKFELIAPTDMKTIDSIMSNGSYQMAITGHGGLDGEPSMVSGFGKDFGKGADIETPKDRITILAEEAKSIIDKEKKSAIFNEMQNIAAEEMKTIPLYYPIWYFVYRHKVFDGWFYTQNGIGVGIPTVYNKLAFVRK